jgi:hypothetical protein
LKYKKRVFTDIMRKLGLIASPRHGGAGCVLGYSVIITLDQRRVYESEKMAETACPKCKVNKDT